MPSILFAWNTSNCNNELVAYTIPHLLLSPFSPFLIPSCFCLLTSFTPRFMFRLLQPLCTLSTHLFHFCPLKNLFFLFCLHSLLTILFPSHQAHPPNHLSPSHSLLMPSLISCPPALLLIGPHLIWRTLIYYLPNGYFDYHQLAATMPSEHFHLSSSVSFLFYADKLTPKWSSCCVC